MIGRIIHYHDLLWAEIFEVKRGKESRWITWFGTSIIMGINIISLDWILSLFSIDFISNLLYGNADKTGVLGVFVFAYGPFFLINYMFVMRKERYNKIMQIEVKNKRLLYAYTSFTVIGFLGALSLLAFFR